MTGAPDAWWSQRSKLCKKVRRREVQPMRMKISNRIVYGMSQPRALQKSRGAMGKNVSNSSYQRRTDRFSCFPSILIFLWLDGGRLRTRGTRFVGFQEKGHPRGLCVFRHFQSHRNICATDQRMKWCKGRMTKAVYAHTFWSSVIVRINTISLAYKYDVSFTIRQSNTNSLRRCHGTTP